MTEHTPTPWKIGHTKPSKLTGLPVSRIDWSEGIIGEVEEPDAAFIVRACNSHEAFVNIAAKLLNSYDMHQAWPTQQEMQQLREIYEHATNAKGSA